MADENIRYSWDIQKSIYLKGEDLLKANTPMDSKAYDFEFDRFYAIHEGETKKYNIVATLNADVAQKEALAGRPVQKTKSEFKNLDFKWNEAGEIWHIDMPKENYDKLSYKIYTEDNLGNPTNPNCTEYKTDDGFIYDYYGKNRIYFVYDAGMDMTPHLDKLDVISESDQSAINDVIIGIRELIPQLKEKGITEQQMISAGFYPANYTPKEG